MKKLTAFFLMICMLVSLISACGNKAAQPTIAAEPASTTQPAATTEPEPTPAPETEPLKEVKHTQYPLTITTYNYAKEQVEYTFEKAPERVYANCQDSIEILLALGLADKIVGCSGLDGEVLPELADEFAKVTYYESRPDKEAFLDMDLDFIVGWYSLFSDKRLGDVDFWHERNIGTYMMLNSACRGKAVDHPQTVEHECQDILTLGEIFDVQDRAEELVAGITKEVAAIDEFLAGKERISVAVLEDEGGTYRVYSEDTLGGNVAIHGGAKLAVGEHGWSGNLSAEDLIITDPEAIFMVWYEGYSVGDVEYNGDNVVSLITENPAFASLQAVKNGRVYAINLTGIYCSGMHTLNGIRDFSTNLYPELYQ